MTSNRAKDIEPIYKSIKESLDWCEKIGMTFTDEYFILSKQEKILRHAYKKLAALQLKVDALNQRQAKYFIEGDI